jgi:hypothetical protein
VPFSPHGQELSVTAKNDAQFQASIILCPVHSPLTTNPYTHTPTSRQAMMCDCNCGWTYPASLLCYICISLLTPLHLSWVWPSQVRRMARLSTTQRDGMRRPRGAPHERPL